MFDLHLSLLPAASAVGSWVKRRDFLLIRERQRLPVSGMGRLRAEEEKLRQGERVKAENPRALAGVSIRKAGYRRVIEFMREHFKYETPGSCA